MSPSDEPSPKPVSERKRAANRANAQKSTGPRTAEGKARSAMNAMLCDEGIRLAAAMPGDSRHFAALFAKLVRADLRPQNFVQTLLVERATDLLWKLRQARAAQGAFVGNEFADLLRFIDSEKKQGTLDGQIAGLFTGESILLDVVSRPAGEKGAYLRLDLYADRLQRAVTSVLLRLRQEQDRTGVGEPPRDREFRMSSLRRDVRRAGSPVNGDNAESLSEPTRAATSEAPPAAPTPGAAASCDGTERVGGGGAENFDGQNEPTEAPPAARFEGTADPSLN